MSNNPKIHVWITKYALTQGIFEADVEHCVNISDKMVVDRTSMFASYHKPHWHLTRQDAVGQAENMRKKKIAALRRQLSEVQKLRFT